MLCLRIRGLVAVSAHLSGTRVRRGLSAPQVLTFAHRSTSQRYPLWSGFTLTQKYFLTTSSTSRTPPPPSSTTPTAPPSPIRRSILSRFLPASLSVHTGSTSSTSTSLVLWCYIEGRRNHFRIRTSRDGIVEDLKEKIYNKKAPYFAKLGVPHALRLGLGKIDVDPRDRATMDLIKAGQYQPPSDHQSLDPTDALSDVWPVQPPSNHLHIFVELPAGGSPTLVRTDSSERTIRRKKDEQAGGLPGFLRSVTLPSHTINWMASTQTHPYDTVSASISESDFPFIAIKFQNMGSSMVDDLFDRVLPKHHVVNSIFLDDATTMARLYTMDVDQKAIEIGPEADVWQVTHRILGTCIICLAAVGQHFQLKTEVVNNRVNVQMDSVVKDTQRRMVLAVEDKSPKVFNKHCTEEEVDAVCRTAPLSMNSTEYGFRSIFFKLTVYMVKEGVRWGVLHCGTSLRIIRIEHKDKRPYAIISEEMAANHPPPRSLYALICYILLTGKEDIPFFDEMRDTVPAPPQIVGSRDAGLQTRNDKPQLFAPAPPEDLTTMTLHTTAAAGRLFVDIPMMRVDKMQMPVTHVQSADVYLKDFLGAGGFGRVFLAELFIHDLCYGQVVVKLAKAGVEEYLDIEARAYAKLRSLHGVGIPRYYGHFTGEHAGIQYSCILVDACGDPVNTIPNLPLFQRLEIFRILLTIHRQGVVHNDLSPRNILSTKSQIRLIDFSAAIINHECSGLGSCWELNSAVTELRLTPLHTQFVILWSLWPDIFHPSVSRQSTVATLFVLFVFVFTGLWNI